MIFGGFMVHEKIIKLLWNMFNTIYEKYIYIYIYHLYVNSNTVVLKSVITRNIICLPENKLLQFIAVYMYTINIYITLYMMIFLLLRFKSCFMKSTSLYD